jgi:RNA polymerase sigma-70 factor (ECF subfamily)
VVQAALAVAGPERVRRSAGADPFMQEVLALTPKLRAYAAGLTGCPERADDLLHDTLVKVIRFRHRFEPGTNLRAWLYAIVRNSYLTNLRQRSRLCEDPDGRLSAELASAPTQEWRLRHRELLRALLMLSPDQRSLLMLIAGGSSYEEAAEVCGCPVGTVKSRINRARHRLLKILDAEPFEFARA